MIIRFLRVSSSHCFVHLSGSFLPGLISFGDLAGSLEGKMVLLLKIVLISNPLQPLLGVGEGDGVRAHAPLVHRCMRVAHGQALCAHICVRKHEG